MDKLKLWIVQFGEPVFGVDGAVRKGRCTLLSEEAVRRGHRVLWWTSTYDHFKKKYRFIEQRVVKFGERSSACFLHAGPAYRRNISLSRILNQKALAREFGMKAEIVEPPDLIYCCWPTPEAASYAVEYARPRGVPVVIDIRDLWPDIYLRVIPHFVRPVVKLILAPEFSRASRTMRRVDALVAVSKSYLQWALRYAERKKAAYDRVFPLGYEEHVPRETIPIIQDRLRRRFGLSGQSLLLTYSGVFGAFYDLHTVVSAARVLRDRGIRGVLFLLAGSGDKEQALRAAARGLSNVVFTGWLQQDELTGLLGMSDVGLSAYTRNATQSLPNKPFDYMAAGLPQISSLRGELEGILKEYRVGLQYTAGNASSLADQVCWFALDRERRREMSHRARMLFERTYDAKVIYPNLVEHLEGVYLAARGNQH